MKIQQPRVSNCSVRELFYTSTAQSWLLVQCNYYPYAYGKEIGHAPQDLLTIKTCMMKKVLAMAAIVMSLAACNNTGNDSETNADTTSSMYNDTMNGRNSGGLDTSAVNTGDSTGINRDTSRADRTRNMSTTDTSARRRSDTLR